MRSYRSELPVLSVFVRAFRTPDLRKKLLFTGAMIVLFRFGSNLPAPGISEQNVSYCSAMSRSGGVFAILNLLSGNSLLHLTDVPEDRVYAAILTSLIGEGSYEVAGARSRRQAESIIDAVIEYARRLLASDDRTLCDQTLDQFLQDGGFSGYFAAHFALPLVAAVWSCPPGTALSYPARYLCEFLANHGMLSVSGSPPWRTGCTSSSTR